MSENAEAKSSRLLVLYTRLNAGKVLKKSALAQEFGVTERSVQRDIESLRCFLADEHMGNEVVYDRVLKGYRLEKSAASQLNNSEILAVCKILLESRSMRKDEMMPILDKLVQCCIPSSNRKAVHQLLSNETFHYIEPHHGRPVLEGLWELSQAIHNHQVVEIQYERVKEPKLVNRCIEPVGLLFSEYYFYLTAFLRDVDRENHFDNKDDLFPTIYRVDRIQSFKVLDEHFRVPYKDRFEEGEFRKRVQFMYGGKLETVKFRYTGPSIEAVLDRLPTAQILSEDENGWMISAEVFGKGIEMWLRSQIPWVNVERNDISDSVERI